MLKLENQQIPKFKYPITSCTSLNPENPDSDKILNKCLKKIRELKQILKQAGFTEIPGKGSHTNWIHQLYNGKISISGKDSADAKKHQ